MNNEIVYVRRLKDGAVLDIPKRDLEATLKRGFELVEEDPIETIEPSENIAEPSKTEFQCSLCDKIYKTQKTLDKHTNAIHR